LTGSLVNLHFFAFIFVIAAGASRLRYNET